MRIRCYSCVWFGRNEVTKIKKVVKDIDANAFLIISNAREVFGKGFK